MSAGEVVRLRNLPWSASAPDVRTFFQGLNIPNGGVRIIGGDDGDCFVIFTNEADARQAIRKDGSFLNDQRIRLDASSEEEMRYVIAVAKGENPPKPPAMYSDREKSYSDGYNNRKRPSSSIRREEPPSKYGERNQGRQERTDWQENRRDSWNKGGYDHVRDPDQNRHSYNISNQPSTDNFDSKQSIQKVPTYYNKYENQFNNEATGRSNMSGNRDRQDSFRGAQDAHRPQSKRNFGDAHRENRFQSVDSGRHKQGGNKSHDQRVGDNQSPNTRGSNSHTFSQIDSGKRSSTYSGNANRYDGQAPQNKSSQSFSAPYPQSNSDMSGPNSNYPQANWNISGPSNSNYAQPSPNFPYNPNHDQHSVPKADAHQHATSDKGYECNPHVGNANFGLPPPTIRPNQDNYGHRQDHHENRQRFGEIPERAFNDSRNQHPSLPPPNHGNSNQHQFHGRSFEDSRNVHRTSQGASPNSPRSWDRSQENFNDKYSQDRDQRRFSNSHSSKDGDLRKPPTQNPDRNFSRFSDSDLRHPAFNKPQTEQNSSVRASSSAGLLPTPDVNVQMPAGSGLNNEMAPMNTNINNPNLLLPPPNFNGPESNRSMPLLPSGPPPISFGPNNSNMQMNVYNDQRMGPPNFNSLPAPPGNNDRMMPNSLSSPSSDASSKPSAVVPVTDPCGYITNLPNNVVYKQLRGLFATHSILAEDIVINYPPKPSSEPASATVLFDDINNTVTALNELKGMKISGFFIVIEPCSRAKFEDDKQRSRPQGRSSQINRVRPLMDKSLPPSTLFKNEQLEAISREWDNNSDNQVGSDKNKPRGHNEGDRYSRVNRRPERDMRAPERSRDRRRSMTPPRGYQSRNRSPRRGNRSPSARHRSPLRRRSPSRELPYTRDPADSRTDNNRSRSKDRSIDSTGNPHSKQPQTTDNNSSQWCAVLTGLPPKVTKSDVEKLLTDVSYEPRTLYLEFNVHKECTGTAYVELMSEADQRKLTGSPREIFKQTVHISAVTSDEMRKYVAEHKRHLAADKTKPGEFLIHLIGLPFDATPKTVSEFLHPAHIKETEVTLVKSPDGSGRCSGNGFVKVHSIEDREEALKHDRGYIGKRYVTVRVVSETYMKDLIAKYDDERIAKSNEVNKQSDPSAARTIRMVNLRYHIQESEVENFFREFNPVRGSVKFSMMNGMPTGKGSIQMNSAEEAAKAVERLNKSELSGRPLLLSILM